LCGTRKNGGKSDSARKARIKKTRKRKPSPYTGYPITDLLKTSNQIHSIREALSLAIMDGMSRHDKVSSIDKGLPKIC